MRIHIWSWKNLKRRVGAVLLVLAAVALLKRPQAVATGVSRGLSLCGGVIIPSLFVFLVLAGLWTRTGIGAAFGRRLARPVAWLYRLPSSAASALLIGWVGGYPAGAVAVRDLLDRQEITPKQAKRLLCGCVNGGPAFIIGGVGAGMLGSPAKGAILFLAHLLASFVTGLIFMRGENEPSPSPKAQAKPEPLSTALAASVQAACRSMLGMCGFVILCAALLSLTDAWGVGEWLRKVSDGAAGQFGLSLPLGALFAGFMEVSCGCVEAARIGETAPFMLGCILGWGGISVHGQVASVMAGQRVLDKTFFAARGLQALLGGVLSQILFRLIPLSTDVLSAGDGAGVQWYTTSIVAAAALLVLCGLWLLCLPAERA